MWERRHSLGPSRRTDGGQREYSQVDIDHLSLIKQLVDDGMRIKDIAGLPQKTLTLIANKPASKGTREKQSFETIIIGKAFSSLFKKHRNRYPRLAIEFPELSAEQWLAQYAESSSVNILIIQTQKVNQSMVNKIKQLKQQGCTVFLHHPVLSIAMAEQLNKIGVHVVNPPITLAVIDRLTAKAKKEQTYLSGLFDSSSEFNLPLPSTIPHYFSEQALTEAATSPGSITCKCPAHLSELIQSINAFEEYSQQCGADNWKEASIHACIYAYTVQARGLLEKALLAAMDED